MAEQTRARCESHCSLHSWKALGYCDAENSGGIEVGHSYPRYINSFPFCFPTRFIAQRQKGGGFTEVVYKVRGWQNKVKKTTNNSFLVYIHLCSVSKLLHTNSFVREFLVIAIQRLLLLFYISFVRIWF